MLDTLLRAPIKFPIGVDIKATHFTHAPIKPHSNVGVKFLFLNQKFVRGLGWGDVVEGAFVGHHSPLHTFW